MCVGESNFPRIFIHFLTLKTMKLLRYFLPVCLLVCGIFSCSEQINYDDYNTVPIIDSLQFSLVADTEDPLNLLVDVKAKNADFYLIQFGDGTDTIVSENGVASHQYAEAGKYDVFLRADTDGMTYLQKIQPVGVAIIADLDFSVKPSDKDPTIVELLATSSVAEKYIIDWGDESVTESEDGNATHKYTFDGDYLVTVTAQADKYIEQTLVKGVSVVGGLEYIFIHDFENDTHGWNGGSLTQDANCGSGALLIEGKNSSQVDFDPIAGTVNIEWDFSAENVMGTYSSFMVNQPADGKDGRIQININNGQWDVKFGNDNLFKGGTVENNTCYAMKIAIDRETNKWKLFADGIQQGADFDATGLADIFNLKLITFVEGDPQQKYYLNNARISKIAGAKTVYVNEDFENGASNWSNAAVTAQDPNCGSSAIYLAGKSDGHKLEFSPISSSVTIEYDFSVSNVVGTFSNLLINDGFPDREGRIQLNINAGLWEFKIGTEGIYKGGTVENNKCYNVKVVIDKENETLKFFVDGIQEGGDFSTANLRSTVDNVKLITFGEGDPAQNFYVDNLKITEL